MLGGRHAREAVALALQPSDLAAVASGPIAGRPPRGAHRSCLRSIHGKPHIRTALRHGPHFERCNPSFLWSEDSRYLAVPQYHGFFGRQRLLILAFEEKRIFASKQREWYFQPEWFSGQELVVKINPFKSDRMVTFRIPSELSTRFNPLHWREFRWPEAP